MAGRQRQPVFLTAKSAGPRHRAWTAVHPAINPGLAERRVPSPLTGAAFDVHPACAEILGLSPAMVKAACAYWQIGLCCWLAGGVMLGGANLERGQRA
jgi:hypothetical protein